MLLRLLRTLNLDEAMAPRAEDGREHENAGARARPAQLAAVHEEEHFSQFEHGQLEMEPEPDYATRSEIPQVVPLIPSTQKTAQESTTQTTLPQVPPGSVIPTNNNNPHLQNHDQTTSSVITPKNQEPQRQHQHQTSSTIMMSCSPPDATREEQSKSAQPVAAPSSGLFKGFWQLVAPDPNSDLNENVEVEVSPEANTAQHQPPHGPDGHIPQHAHHQRQQQQPRYEEPSLVQEGDILNDYQDDSSAITTPQKPRFSTTAKTPSPTTPISVSSLSDTDNEEMAMAQQIMLSTRKTAESYGSPTPIWDQHALLYKLCIRASLSEKMQKRFRQKLKKQPELLTVRSSKQGVALPDGYSPLHAAAYYGNLDAAQILISFSDELYAKHGNASMKISCLDVNSQGQTALHVASEQQKSLPLITFLKECWVAEMGYEPTGALAPTDLNGRTPLACAHFASNTFGGGATIDKVEQILFSPGDRSICPASASKCGGAGQRGRNKTPYRGRLSTARKASRQRSIMMIRETGCFDNNNSSSDFMYAVAEFPGRRVLMEDAWNVVCPLSRATSTTVNSQLMGEEESCFLGVYDGHGDQGRVSRFVADNLPPCLLQSQAWTTMANDEISNNDDTDTAVHVYTTAFHEACLTVDKQLRDSDEFGAPIQGGSTGVSALVTPTHVVVANVGDSRAILIQLKTETHTSSDGNDTDSDMEVVEMSHDHKPCAVEEKTRIEAAGLTVVEETFQVDSGEMMTLSKVQLVDQKQTKLATSRCFGDFDFKANKDIVRAEEQAIVAVPEVIVHTRSSDDRLLVLACDGIWDVMTNMEVATFLWNKAIAATAAERGTGNCKDHHNITTTTTPTAMPTMTTDLLDTLTHALLNECYARKSSDNLTAIVCALGDGSISGSSSELLEASSTPAVTKLESKFALEI
jgi:serine/threonine protein phosphatase PrpC